MSTLITWASIFNRKLKKDTTDYSSTTLLQLIFVSNHLLVFQLPKPLEVSAAWVEALAEPSRCWNGKETKSISCFLGELQYMHLNLNRWGKNFNQLSWSRQCKGICYRLKHFFFFYQTSNLLLKSYCHKCQLIVVNSMVSDLFTSWLNATRVAAI